MTTQICPNQNQLAMLINGGISSDEEVQLAAHLDTCATCQETLESLASEQGLRDDVVKNLGSHRTVIGGGMNTEIQQAVKQLRHDLSNRETRAFSVADEEPLTFLDPTDDPDHLGRLGSYEVIDEIGRGGMGIVLKARDPSLNRIVALKVLAPHQAWNATARQRFVREARSAAAVNHRHVVTIHAVEDNNTLPFLVMEYLDGQSLEQRMVDEPLTVKEIVRIGIQAAAGLAAAHECGLVHRDIKPGNILLENGTDWVKITDFGLARTADDAQLTKSGILTGTPAFMAPEQASDGPIDHRADLFSLGSVLYALCTRRPPFKGPSVLALINQLQNEAPIAVNQFNPAVPAWLVEVIGKLHAKNPADRFQTSDEVVRLLMQRYAEIQNDSPSPPPAAHPPIQNVVAAQSEPPAILPAKSSLWEHVGVRISLAATIVLVVFASIVGLVNAALSPSDPAPVDPQPIAKIPPPIVDHRPTIRAENKNPKLNPRGEQQAFSVGSRKFQSLQAAVGSAQEGDTIEIHGNGPFMTPPIAVDNRRLTIVAAEGFEPIIEQSPGTEDFPLIHTNTPLTIRGIELRRPTRKRPPNGRPQQIMSAADFLVVAFRTALFVDNCRFIQNEGGCIWSEEAPLCEVENSTFLCRDGLSIRWGARDDSRLKLVNCVHAVRNAVTCQSKMPVLPAGHLEIHRNTIIAKNAISLLVRMPPEILPPGREEMLRPLVIDANQNVFDVRMSVVQIFQTPRDVSDFRALPTGSLNWLHRVVTWQGHENAFAHSMRLLGATIGQRQINSGDSPHNLTEWNEFWKIDSPTSVQGEIRYVSDRARRAMIEVDYNLSIADFRLAPDSIGKNAGAVSRE